MNGNPASLAESFFVPESISTSAETREAIPTFGKVYTIPPKDYGIRAAGRRLPWCVRAPHLASRGPCRPIAARSSLSKPDCSRTLVRVCDSCVTDWRKRLRVAAGPRENKPLRSSKVARYTRQSLWTVRRLIIIAIVNRLALRHANPKERLEDPQRASGLTGAGDRPLLCRAHSLGPIRRIRGGPTACPRNVLRNDKLDMPTFDIMSVLLGFALLAFIENTPFPYIRNSSRADPGL